MNKHIYQLITLLSLLAMISTACAPFSEISQTVQLTDPIEEMNTQQIQVQALGSSTQDQKITYSIVDTSQGVCYDNQKEVPCESIAASFNGQDAQYTGNQAQYQDNGDGTVTDLVTGLMWQQDPGEKMTYSEAAAGAGNFTLAGYDDWRLPTIKELYSLILFDGEDVSYCPGGSCDAVPFIDTRYFNFEYGNTDNGERAIDSQWASSTLYVSTTMNGMTTMFGVNFADGRIKGYPVESMTNKGAKTFYVIYVRGGEGYGVNDFVDNGNGTISDQATGLTWMQSDSGEGMDWEDALGYCEALNFGGSDDWRLPNIKELQSIADYSRSPDTTGSAAIDPIFEISRITNEMGENDYPYFWSSTTHVSSGGQQSTAKYIAFGKATGNMNGTWMDVHGAGAQRSDPKSGDPEQFAQGRGPQGDAIHIENYVRCVSGGVADFVENGVTVVERTSMQVTSTGVEMNNVGPQQEQPANAQQTLPRGQAPEEAIQACASSRNDDRCSFITPHGEENGVCRMVESQELACVPENGASTR